MVYSVSVLCFGTRISVALVVVALNENTIERDKEQIEIIIRNRTIEVVNFLGFLATMVVVCVVYDVSYNFFQMKASSSMRMQHGLTPP